MQPGPLGLDLQPVPVVLGIRLPNSLSSRTLELVERRGGGSGAVRAAAIHGVG